MKEAAVIENIIAANEEKTMLLNEFMLYISLDIDNKLCESVITNGKPFGFEKTPEKRWDDIPIGITFIGKRGIPKFY